LEQAARDPMKALSLGASGGWGCGLGLGLVFGCYFLVDWVRAARAIDHVQNHCRWRRRGHVPGFKHLQPCPAAQGRPPASSL
jgi:hypothetical protein